MSREIAVFKNPSDIVFKTAPDKDVEVFTIRDAQRGNTFLHRGAVCMLSEVSAYQALELADDITPIAKNRIKDVLKSAHFIVNLQTGRTFAVKPDDEIEWIKVTMTVEGK